MLHKQKNPSWETKTSESKAIHTEKPCQQKNNQKNQNQTKNNPKQQQKNPYKNKIKNPTNQTKKFQ